MGKACVAIFWPTPGTDAENSAVQCTQASFRDEALNKFSIERLTRDQKVSGSIPGRSGGRMFFFAVSTFCTKSVKVSLECSSWTPHGRRRPGHYTEKEDLNTIRKKNLRRRPGHYTKEEDLDIIRKKKTWTLYEDLDTIRKKKTWTLYERRRPGHYTIEEEDLDTIRKKKKTWTLYERRAGHYTKEEEDLDTVRKKKKKTWTLYERRRRPGHYTKEEDLDTIRKKKKKTWTLYERRRRRPVEWWQTLLVSTSGRTGRWSARTFHP